MTPPAQRADGYAMAALLAAMAVLGVAWTVAVPVWQQAAQREREAELVFRGEQYARAIRLYRAQHANQNPPDLDALVEERFLRRQYRDPMVPDGQFQLLRERAGPLEAQGGAAGEVTVPDDGPGRSLMTLAAGPAGGVAGVVSRSDEESLRVYQGRTRYSEWEFTYQSLPGREVPSSGAPAAAEARDSPVRSGPRP